MRRLWLDPLLCKIENISRDKNSAENLLCNVAQTFLLDAGTHFQLFSILV
jgi:hypothetical protein